jgi:hypothetical protein
MWEAFFAFHICTACFLFRIRKNTRVSPRIPESRKSLILHGCLKVSVSIPSTTLGGVECRSANPMRKHRVLSTAVKPNWRDTM